MNSYFLYNLICTYIWHIVAQILNQSKEILDISICRCIAFCLYPCVFLSYLLYDQGIPVRGHPISHFCISKLHSAFQVRTLLCSHFWTPLHSQFWTCQRKPYLSLPPVRTPFHSTFRVWTPLCSTFRVRLHSIFTSGAASEVKQLRYKHPGSVRGLLWVVYNTYT